MWGWTTRVHFLPRCGDESVLKRSKDGAEESRSQEQVSLSQDVSTCYYSIEQLMKTKWALEQTSVWWELRHMTETIFGKNTFYILRLFSLLHVPLSNMEGTKIMTYTTLHFWVAVMSSILIYSLEQSFIARLKCSQTPSDSNQLSL